MLQRNYFESEYLFTPRQAAKYLAVSERTLWSLKDDGTIPHVKIGRLVRYRREDLESFIEQQLKGGKSNDTTH